jgi:hypothetical protein
MFLLFLAFDSHFPDKHMNAFHICTSISFLLITQILFLVKYKSNSEELQVLLDNLFSSS